MMMWVNEIAQWACLAVLLLAQIGHCMWHEEKSSGVV